MPPLEVTELSEGVWQLQSQLLATNSVLVSDVDGCVVCDPSIFADEVAEIRARAGSPTATHLLITHSDWDHTCGISAFAGAAVAAGAGTALAIADGTAADKLRRDGQEWGLAEPGALRVDRVLEAGREIAVGSERVLVIDAPGHAKDGSAFLLANRGLLLTGDYLSAATHPVLWASLAEAIESYGRLLAAVRSGQVRLVVPGHGPAIALAEAVRIAEEDVAYLRTLRDAALAAVRHRASTGEAVLAAYAVEPPRPDRIGLEAFGLRSSNAQLAVHECQATGAGA
jgi:glyoxylase-like metal-dependent hydrolase (beta-lactamase superfamily II)